MTKCREALLAEARAAGYSVEAGHSGETYVIKRVGRWRKLVGLQIDDDGTAFDVSVAPSVARGMRSYRDMRRVLGLGPERRGDGPARENSGILAP